MDAVARSLVVFVILWALLRISGRRTLGEMTGFDFVLLLVIGEASAHMLLGEDLSTTNAVLVIATLVMANVAVAWATSRFSTLAKWMEGVPMILVADGRPLDGRLHKARITEDDIMEAARLLQGLERMEQIKYAILEVSGGISIIPQPQVR